MVGRKKVEVMAPPSWASCVAAIVFGQFGGYVDSWMWAEKKGGTERGAEAPTKGADLSAQVSLTFYVTCWARPEHVHFGNRYLWFLFSHFPKTELSKSTLTSLLALKMQRCSKSNLHSLRKVGPRDYIVQTYTNLVGPGFYAFFSRAHLVLQVNTILLGTSHWDNLTLSFCDFVLVL